MFYDEAFGRITGSSAFSEEAVLTVGEVEYTLHGFFCSGHYGDRKMDKGYTTNKTVKRQSFQMSKVNLPELVTVSDLARQKLSVRGSDFVIREVTGNDSGIVVLDLVSGGGTT